MGLKYEVFMVKGTAEEFHRKLFEAIPDKITDSTDLMNRAHAWYSRKIETMEDYDKEPEPDLKEYLKDELRYSVWWMNHPGAKGFVVGGYTTNWVVDLQCQAILIEILMKAGYTEYLKVEFHHGSNDGSVYKIHMHPENKDEPLTADQYPHESGEQERWERYSRRVNKTCGYPVTAWHKYISNPKIHLVPWDYSIIVKKKSEVNKP